MDQQPKHANHTVAAHQHTRLAATATAAPEGAKRTALSCVQAILQWVEMVLSSMALLVFQHGCHQVANAGLTSVRPSDPIMEM